MKNQFCSRMQNLKPINIISFSRINVNRKIKNAAACGQKKCGGHGVGNGFDRRIKKALVAPLGGLVMSINFSLVFGFPQGRVKI